MTNEEKLIQDIENAQKEVMDAYEVLIHKMICLINAITIERNHWKERCEEILKTKGI